MSSVSSDDHSIPSVFIALGSNLGDSSALVLRALSQLNRLSDKPIVRSSLWQSDPVDCPPESPPFINAIAALEPLPGESPLHLLHELQALEKELGRTPKTVLNQPRLLDLDLIAFGNIQCHSPQLILPHPRAHLRRFVLAPLAELAPTLVLPGQQDSVQQLLRQLGNAQPIQRLERAES